MLTEAIALLRKCCRSLFAYSAPEQLALGLTIGMVIGLLPKGNLIVLSLCLLLFSVRCNKAIGFVTAIAFSFAGHWADSFAHRLGSIALDLERLQATYASMFNLPLGPWIGFDNTVVTGSLLLGLYLAYPVYWISKLLFAAIRPAPTEATP